MMFEKDVVGFKKSMLGFAEDLMAKGFAVYRYSRPDIIGYKARKKDMITYFGFSKCMNMWWTGNSDRAPFCHRKIDKDDKFRCMITLKDIVDSMRPVEELDEEVDDLYIKLM